MEAKIPEPPKDQITIPQEDIVRLNTWLEFFRKLSSRVEVIQPRDNKFEGFLEKADRIVRKHKHIYDPEIKLIGWPEEKEIAFTLTIDSSALGSIVPVVAIQDVYFFCFGDRSFGPRYFEWDGDGEAGNWAKTYSISSYSKDALSWQYVTSLIIGRVKELESRIPEPPQ